MRNTDGASHRQEADSGRSVTQVFYADGDKTGTGTVQAVLGQLEVEVTQFGNSAELPENR
jgi:uncharacterized protein with FMN-binding domain